MLAALLALCVSTLIASVSSQAPLLDPIVASSHSNCLSYPDAQGSYSVQACPMAAGSRPVTLTGETLLSFSSRDDSLVRVPMPFTVSVYGVNFSSVAVVTNGELQFGAGATSTGTYGEPIPSDAFEGGVGPVILPCEADMFLLTQDTTGTVTSNVSTGTVGTSPNRLFVVRYTKIAYYATRNDDAPSMVSFDVVFYENATANFEIRYNQFDSTATVATSIGAQGTDMTRYVALYSSNTSLPAISAALQGNTVTFTYLNPNVPPPPSMIFTVDPIVPSAHTACISYPEPQGLYRVQACPMVTGTATVYPASLTSETLVPFPASSRDDNWISVALPFPVSVYGRAYLTVAVVTNGHLQFGSAPTASGTYGVPIPSTVYSGNVGPVIEMSQADMYLNEFTTTTQKTNVSTGTDGATPNRLFVVRYNKLAYYSSRATLVSYDVVFFENATANFEIRYNRYDSTATVATSIGIQANDTTHYVAVYSSNDTLPAISTALQGNALSFTWLGASAPSGSSSTGGGVPVPGGSSSSTASNSTASSSAGSSSGNFSSSSAASSGNFSSSSAASSGNFSSSSAAPPSGNSSSAAIASSSSSGAASPSSSSLIGSPSSSSSAAHSASSSSSAALPSQASSSSSSAAAPSASGDSSSSSSNPDSVESSSSSAALPLDSSSSASVVPPPPGDVNAAHSSNVASSLTALAVAATLTLLAVC